MMRRVNTKYIIKEHFTLIIFAALTFIFGAYLCAGAIWPDEELTPDKLMEKHIEVSKLKYVDPYRGAPYYLVMAENGEKYTVSGTYYTAALKETLVPGSIVTVRYYVERMLLWQMSFAEEIYSDESCLVAFDGKEQNRVAEFLVGVFFVVFALTDIAYLRWLVKHNRQLQEKRDRRIARKYEKAQS